MSRMFILSCSASARVRNPMVRVARLLLFVRFCTTSIVAHAAEQSRVRMAVERSSEFPCPRGFGAGYGVDAPCRSGDLKTEIILRLQLGSVGEHELSLGHNGSTTGCGDEDVSDFSAPPDRLAQLRMLTASAQDRPAQRPNHDQPTITQIPLHTTTRLILIPRYNIRYNI